MKKSTKKYSLKSEMIRNLTDAEMANAGGGTQGISSSGPSYAGPCSTDCPSINICIPSRHAPC